MPPDDYVAFLSETNGAEGPVGESAYLALWPVEDLASLNAEYHIDEFAPELVLIGSDGGDTAFGFNKRLPMQFVAVPFIGMSADQSVEMGRTFRDFLIRLAQV